MKLRRAFQLLAGVALLGAIATYVEITRTTAQPSDRAVKSGQADNMRAATRSADPAIESPAPGNPRTAAQPSDRLPAFLRRVVRMDDLHHLHVEADVGERVGVEVGYGAFLEGRAGDADRPLLEVENAALVHRRNGQPGIDATLHQATLFVGRNSEAYCAALQAPGALRPSA